MDKSKIHFDINQELKDREAAMHHHYVKMVSDANEEHCALTTGDGVDDSLRNVILGPRSTVGFISSLCADLSDHDHEVYAFLKVRAGVPVMHLIRERRDGSLPALLKRQASFDL